MLARLTGMASAVAVVLGLSAMGAVAQNYDGSGLVRFGFFGQGTSLDVGVSQPVPGSASPSGFAGGVAAGYDLVAKGRWILGAEIDGSFGDARGDANGTSYGFDYLATVRARFGFFPRHDWLLYGTAGVGFLGFEAQQPLIGAKAMRTATGFVGGVGTEVEWYHVSLFAEYLYGAFGDSDFEINNVRHEIDLDAHIVRLGIKFKVGHDYEHDLDRGYRRHDPLK
jgi:opacity protein-like surface antigen